MRETTETMRESTETNVPCACGSLDLWIGFRPVGKSSIWDVTCCSCGVTGPPSGDRYGALKAWEDVFSGCRHASGVALDVQDRTGVWKSVELDADGVGFFDVGPELATVRARKFSTLFSHHDPGVVTVCDILVEVLNRPDDWTPVDLDDDGSFSLSHHLGAEAVRFRVVNWKVRETTPGDEPAVVTIGDRLAPVFRETREELVEFFEDSAGDTQSLVPDRMLMLLAADLMSMAAEKYSNHGCNDWEFPKGWTPAQRRAAIDMYADAMECPGEFDAVDFLMDDQVMELLAHWLRGRATKDDPQ